MESTPRRNPETVLSSLEAAAISARGGFACLFSTAEEYEAALISARRARGLYSAKVNRWPAIMFVGCAMIVVGTVLLFA
jgi:hypothetical protein